MQSHPTWVRGLKLAHQYVSYVHQHKVAPYVGAWIETIVLCINDPTSRVAPYVGAWIETLDDETRMNLVKVAPYVGAWIETDKQEEEK